MKPPINILPLLCMLCCAIIFSCGEDPSDTNSQKAENLYEDSISTSYTIALPDDKGEGLRITYTFFNMKRADTGNYKMTHVYMRHTGEEDTTIVNGTWKLLTTDSGKYIRTWSGRHEKEFKYEGEWNLVTRNSDSMIADTGMLLFRQKKDNDMRNSTVLVFGKVIFEGDNGASFLDAYGDTIPVLKISAYRELQALNDSVNLNSPSIKGVELIGTFQIRMAMDGNSIQRSLIVEEVGDVK